MKVEYKIRPVTRYVVTRYAVTDCGESGSSVKGEYDNADVAYQVGYALAKEEHDRLRYPPGDERILYPQPIPIGMPIGGHHRAIFPQDSSDSYIKSQP